MVTDPAVIALLTDFGHRDAYVGVMKAVILSRAPHAQLIDLTHGIAPQDILGGALQLLAAASYCPAGTVFLAVVDPGVGGSRRALCLESGGYRFVGPDNGLLWPAANASGTPYVFHLDNPEHWLPSPGATFHGRDVFAPIAAQLATGVPIESLGSPINDPVRLEISRPVLGGTVIRGEVIYIDHYGNAVTNLSPADLAHPTPESRTFQFESQSLIGPSTHYAARPLGSAVIVTGSLCFYEIAVNGGSAASLLGLEYGNPVEVQ